MATHKMGDSLYDPKSHTLDLSGLPSNNTKAKPEKKDVSPVVSGKVTRRKTSVGRKFVNNFFAESVNDVKNYVIDDVVMPNIKETFLDIIFQGLSMLLTGDPGRGRSRAKSSSQSSSGYKPGRPSYTDYYDSPEKSRKTAITRDSYSLDDMIVDSKGSAEKVLDGLLDCLENYDVATVGDLYQLCGVSTEQNDFNYGWTDLSNASTKRVNGGYLIDLPRAKYIR